MKTFLFVVFCLCLLSATAFGQAASTLSNQITVYQFYSHPERASQHEMAKPDDLMEHSCNVSGHGERPLWELGVIPESAPLGDIARALRDEHATAKRAEVVWEN